METNDFPSNVTRLPEDHDRQLAAWYQQAPKESPAAGLDHEILEASRKAASIEEPTVLASSSPIRVPMPIVAMLLIVVGAVPLWWWYGFQQPAEPEGSEARVMETLPAEGPASALESEASTVAGSGDIPAPALPDAAQEGLAAIESRLQAGNIPEAWQQFQDFRQEYPEIRIPDALLSQLADARSRWLEESQQP